MIVAESQHAEGARYAACLVLVPGLWCGVGVWRGFASYLGHRGWESHLLDVRAVGGGLEARGAAVAEYARALTSPPVLVGHDAGALVALAGARRCSAAAAVLIAPLLAGSRGARALARASLTLPRLLLGRPVPPPLDRAAALAWPGLAAEVGRDLGPEDGRAVRDVVRRGAALAPAPGVPTLLVGGESDALLPLAEAARVAAAIGADHATLDGVGHWPLAGPGCRRTADVVHRWVVKRLGAPLLDLYEEAMAERARDDSDSD